MCAYVSRAVYIVMELELSLRFPSHGTSTLHNIICIFSTYYVPHRDIEEISPLPSLEQQLDQLHRNLRPQLQAMVRRTDFNSVEGLLELVQEAEQTLENAKTFRHPPLPAATRQWQWRISHCHWRTRRNGISSMPKRAKCRQSKGKTPSRRTWRNWFGECWNRAFPKWLAPQRRAAGRKRRLGRVEDAAISRWGETGPRSPLSLSQRRRRMPRTARRHQHLPERTPPKSRDRRWVVTHAASPGILLDFARTVRETQKGASRWNRSRPCSGRDFKRRRGCGIVRQSHGHTRARCSITWRWSRRTLD